MALHIGNIIRRVIDDKRMPIRELAGRVKMHTGSISRLLKYAELNSVQLRKFSVALEHDFFKYYSDDLKLPVAAQEKVAEVSALDECKKENERLVKEVGYLKEINILLKKVS